MNTSPRRPSSARRTAAVGLLSALPAVVIVSSWLAWHRSLPSQIVTHWSDNDQPNGFTSTGVLLGVTLGVCIVVAAASVGIGVERENPSAARPPLLLGGIFSGVASAVWLTCGGLAISGERGVGGWFLLTILGAGYGLIPCLATLGGSSTPRKLPNESITLGSDEEASWSRSVDSNLILALATGVAILGACLLWIPSGGRVTLMSVSVSTLLGVVCLFMAALSRLTVVVDQHGLRVRSDVLRLKLKSIPLEQIVGVTNEIVSSTDWGGWGYRVRPTRSAIVLRSGEGIVVRTTNNRSFAVTVSEPEQGVALLDRYLERRRRLD